MESRREKRLLAALLLSTMFINAAAKYIRSCYQGYTGENDGGSCMFITQNQMCRWKRGFLSQEWTLVKEGIGLKSTRDYNNNAQLISPLMCEDIGIELCVQIRISFPKKSKRYLYFFLKTESKSTDKTLEDTNQNGTRKENISISIPFESPGRFQMVFEVDLYSHVIKPDEDFRIHSIIYHNTSCTARSVLPSTSTFTTESSVFKGNSDIPLHAGGKYTTISIICAIIVIIIILIVIIFVVRRKKRNIGKVDPMRSYSAKEDVAHFNTDCGTDADNTGHVGEHNYSNLTEDQQTVRYSADRNNEYSKFDMDGFTQNIYSSLHGREIRL